MSGLVKDNIFGSSGSVIEAAGGLSWQPVVTASTVTVSAAKGYFINTTSNACTITLPSSAEAGDQIILVDYARTWGTNAITIDSNGLLFQGEEDTYTVDYDTAGQALNLVYSGATVGWTPSSDIVNALEPVAPPTQRGMFAYGITASVVSLKNLVNSSGVIASDVSGVGTARYGLAAASYGTDKAIFAYGTTGSKVSLKNLANNSGVIAADVTGVGTARVALAAAAYGTDKAIFAYGNGSGNTNISNLVNNSGTVASDVTGVGTARQQLAAAGYGTDKALFGYGDNSSGLSSLKNLVSNLGVVASDVTGVGTARQYIAAAGYGGDKALFAYGAVGSALEVSLKNLVSNLGVIAADVTGVGTARLQLAACSYGGDKAVFAYGNQDGSDTDAVSVKNLVNSSGVVAADVTGVGTARRFLAAAGYSISA